MRAEDDVGSFDLAADQYDTARPSYPEGLFHLLASRTGPLLGKRVLDSGAGTGVASRQLIARGARVVALDPGIEMLARARRRTPSLPVVVADAAALPLEPGSLDMVCFAQSWHWVDQRAGATEAARVLGPSGWWAAWWSHPWADSAAWFDRYFSLLERRCPGVSRHQRDIGGFGRAVTSSGAFGPVEHHVVPWQREVTVSEWLVELSSHSYVIALAPSERRALLGEVEGVLLEGFPDRAMSVPYETRVLLARRHGQ